MSLHVAEGLSRSCGKTSVVLQVLRLNQMTSKSKVSGICRLDQVECRSVDHCRL